MLFFRDNNLRILEHFELIKKKKEQNNKQNNFLLL